MRKIPLRILKNDVCSAEKKCSSNDMQFDYITLAFVEGEFREITDEHSKEIIERTIDCDLNDSLDLKGNSRF